MQICKKRPPLIRMQHAILHLKIAEFTMSLPSPRLNNEPTQQNIHQNSAGA